MQIEVGYKYIDRDGAFVDIKSMSPIFGDPYCFIGHNHKHYKATGEAHEFHDDLVTLFGPTNQPLFTKADTGKPRLSLIDPQFIISLGDILTFGAQKYSVDNWKLCTDVSRYKDALLRHTYAYLGGEILDPESGLPHTACIAFNTMALQWFDNNTPSS
jgi:hypothetical protein